ncbi:MAG: DUF4831 family protein [Candidatus Azobacteroides sp.]|nr:DUF4831 family protein [Candidatus Azobacteroides sp.]
MKKRIWVIVPVLLLSLMIDAQTEAVKITATKGNEYGLTYTLPKTVLNVDIQTTKVKLKAGQFYQYAEKYLGVKDAITENKEYWEPDKVDVWGKGIPDKENTYFIQLKSGGMPFMYLTSDGLLCSINADPDFSDMPKLRLSPEEKPAGTNFNTASVMSEELLMAGSTSKMAEIAAKQIYRIRESRMNILTGDADKIPADGESFKLVISQLEAQEKALTEMFTGTVTRETKIQTYTIDPEETMNNLMVCRFSRYFGLVDKNDLSGTPIYLTLRTSENEQLMPVTKEKIQKGIVCRTPGEAQIKVTLSGKTLFDSTLKIAQFGTLTVLPGSIFDDKKNPDKAVFYPDLGALKKLFR